MAPEDLFLFVGAGASASAPAALPLFDWLRDEILHQLGLDRFVQELGKKRTARVAVAQALSPEPFFLDLTLAGIDVEGWLTQVLGHGKPNAAHQALAELAAAGANVWTVNFDRLIEEARLDVNAVAWPNDPTPGANLLKPHGTLGGQLIVTARQVLTGLTEPWYERLRVDVDAKTVIFLGYSGRDVDFRPHWNELLANAREVLWFEQPDANDPTRVRDERAKRLLVRDVNARGVLSFPPPAPPPAGIATVATPNASWTFVAWCRDRGLIDLDDSLARELFRRAPDPSYPPLPGQPRWAKPSVLGHLGDYSAAQMEYLRLIATSRHRLRAARALTRLEITHGGLPIAVALRAAELLPLLRSAEWRETSRRKRLTILHRAGKHDAVLRETRDYDETTLSTYLIIRAAALRITGSLDVAVAVADEALRRARKEKHAVRTAHAAYQKNLALLWAERTEEARRCLDDEFAPLAAIAANRWVAWSAFVAGGLAVREGDAFEAFGQYALSEALFGAEALVDGLVSVSYARLAAHRRAKADDDFAAEMRKLSTLMHSRHRRMHYYGRRNRFTEGAIDIERAEFARIHVGDLAAAESLYAQAAASRYPLHKALGHLGLAMIEANNRKQPTHAVRAKEISERIGFRLGSERANELLRGIAGATGEVFFC